GVRVVVLGVGLSRIGGALASRRSGVWRGATASIGAADRPWPHATASIRAADRPWPHANASIRAADRPWPHANASIRAADRPWPHANASIRAAAGPRRDANASSGELLLARSRWGIGAAVDNFRIQGGAPLRGTVRISGAKNAALPILCASLLADGESTFRNVPDLTDIQTTAALLRHLGLDVEVAAPVVKVFGRPVLEPDAPYDLVRKMRASVLVLGPLVARYGRARVSLPGGCAIGARPI